MASIEDRWMRTVRDQDGKVMLTDAGKPKKERSDRYGQGLRWLVRWREPDGTPRKMSFAKQVLAEAHKATVEADKLRGTYIDVRAGAETFGAYAKRWLADQTTDPLTRENIADRLRRYVEPYPLWKTQLRAIKPGSVQSWLRTLADARTSLDTPLAPTTRAVAFSHVSAIMNAAVLADELIAKNPCTSPTVKPPRAVGKKIVPWVREWVMGLHDALPERYQLFVTLAAGLGLRQGELFGLSPDDVDFLRGWVKVRRQVKLVGNRLVFSLPKGGKERDVPLPASVRDELAAYLAKYPAVAVTLPWGEQGGKPTTVKLAVTTDNGESCNRNSFNKVWRAARERVGIPSDRENGMHSLRHYYASVLLDAGENVKALSEYLGHHSATVTLNYYAHLMPASEGRVRSAIDAVFLAPQNSDGSFTVTKLNESPNAPDVPQVAAGGGVTSGYPQ